MLATKPGREQLFSLVYLEIGYLNRGVRSFLAPPPTMASPFLVVPVDLCALFVQASLWRDRTDPLALSDDIL